MKNNLKKITVFLFLITTIVLISCSEEIYEHHGHEHHDNKNRITLNRFKQETNIKNFSSLLKMPVPDISEANRTATLSEFIIDTIAIEKHISEENKITYSFRIYSLNEISASSEIYNLVYAKENNVWEKSIISFKENTVALENENQFQDFQKIYDSRFSNEQSREEVCISETYNFHCTGTGDCSSGRCDMCYLCVDRTITVNSCGGSPAGNTSPIGNNNTGGSGSTPLNPYEFTPNLFDNPSYDDPNYVNAVKAQYFFNGLDYAQQVWANENLDSYTQCIQYLIANSFSDESCDFIKDAINLSRDLEINVMDVWKDYELFRAQMSNDERNIFDNMLINRRLMYIVAAKKAVDETNERYPTTAKNGIGDAFRHALWNGMSSLLIGQSLTEQLTTAHETRPSDYTFTYKEKEMDLYNNLKGRQIASYSNIFSITDNVVGYLQIGGLRYLNNLDSNFLATNNSILVPTN